MPATPMAVIPTKFASAKTRAKTSQRRDFTINGMMLDPLVFDNLVLDN